MSSKILGNYGVRINAIAPGNILFKGSVWEKKIKKNKKKVINNLNLNVALKKLGTPENVSDICLFLASKKSGFVTGSLWTADGGQLKNLNK